MDIVAKIIESGGAVALAVVIWAELRLFRKAMVDAMTSMVEKQTQIIERQKVVMEHLDHLHGRSNGAREVGLGFNRDR